MSRDLFNIAALTAGLAVAAVLGPSASAQPVAHLERVSFTPSSSLPGVVVRLHMDRRVDAFELRRDDRAGILVLVAPRAGASDALTCEGAPVPFTSCAVSTDETALQVQLGTAGEIVTADAYRDGTDRSDLLIYVHAAPSRSALADEGAPPVNEDVDIADLDPAGPVAERHEGAAMAPATLLPTSLPSGEGRLPGTVPDEADRLRETAEHLRIDTVVIDAGHGGKDSGTIGYNRIREKDLVLDVALRVGRYLEEAGIRVKYTRDDDTFIELKDRGRIALEAGGKLFVSIHANSAPNRSARGTETFFLGANKSSAAREVIERENQVIDLEEDQSHYEQFDGARLARLRLTQSANLRQSSDLAGRVQEQYRERVGRHDRQVKEGNFYVLWSAGMPAILTEIGFISNPEEARFLTSEQGKDYMASAIFRAIRDYAEDRKQSIDVVARG